MPKVFIRTGPDVHETIILEKVPTNNDDLAWGKIYNQALEQAFKRKGTEDDLHVSDLTQVTVRGKASYWINTESVFKLANEANATVVPKGKAEASQ